MARGGTGIRVRFRIVFRKDWEFKSPRAHKASPRVLRRGASKLLCLRGYLKGVAPHCGARKLVTKSLRTHPLDEKHIVCYAFW